MKRRRKYKGKIKDNKDRLSDLPDCVLIHMLSFLDSKEGVKTCLLSTRWKHLWRYLNTLTLQSYNFSSFQGFIDFCNRILSLRDASTEVNALFFDSIFTDSQLLETIVRYAVSHNVNRLSLASQHMDCFPPSLFSSLTLTSLDIGFPDYKFRLKFPNSMTLPALTYLKLRYISFCSVNDDGRVEPFSTYKRLNTLILYHCFVADAQTLCISSTSLLNLSINSGFDDEYYLNIQLCSPNLCTFAFTGSPILKPSGSNLFSIEQVSIHLNLANPNTCSDSCLILFNWLRVLVNIKSLTVSATTLRVLSDIPDLLKVTPPSWHNLKSLKVNIMGPHYYLLPGMVKFLLRNSPSANVEVVQVVDESY